MKPHHRLASVFGAAGVLHFVKPDIFDQIVPPQLPGRARDYTILSGIAEVAVSYLLIDERTRRTGGFASAALLGAVWPANIYMAYLWRDKPWYMQLISYGRIPYQIPLIKRALNVARSARS